jgi:hypothetical protein
VQSNATVESTLAQYRVGKLTFASVLEAVAGTIADEDGYLETIVEAQRVAIARAEASLDPVGGSTPGAMGGGSMPGAGPTAGGAMRGEPSPAAEAAASAPRGGM